MTPIIRNKNILVFLLSSIALIAAPHVSHLPGVVWGFFYVLLAWRFIGIWQPRYLPNRWLVFLLTTIGLSLLYSQHEGILGRDAGTGLFMTALGLKLLEIKSARDLYLISYLAFIVAASQFLYEQSMVMAVYIMFVCSVLLATLVSINSCNAKATASLGAASRIIVQAIPMAVVLFVMFPRMEAPKWMLFNESSKASSGLSDSMQPGSISDLAMSPELVFRVKFTGPLPPAGQRYWRGPVLVHTDGKKWTQIYNPRYRSRMDKVVYQGTPYQYTLLMEPQSQPWVFALDMPENFPKPLQQTVYFQLTSTENPVQRAEYKLSSYPRYNTGFITRSEFQDSVQLPESPSAEIKQLVGQLKGFDNAPEVFIKQVLNHFRQENFRYTLTPPLMEEHPIESFLFTNKAGFCSHYAAAFVYLMRVAEIPARVVTGYQGGELNKVGDFLEIRQADAHAWAEVWLEHKGWVRVDPTAAIAPERVDRTVNFAEFVPGGLIRFTDSAAAGQASGWISQARQIWGVMDYNWQHFVIHYDTKNQSNLLTALGIADIKTLAYSLMAIIAVITSLLSWFLLYHKPQQIDPSVQIYLRFCKKLAKKGLVRDSGEGARDFAERAKISLPGQAAQIGHITDLFIKLHYGKQAGPLDVKIFKRWVAAFKVG